METTIAQTPTRRSRPRQLHTVIGALQLTGDLYAVQQDEIDTAVAACGPLNPAEITRANLAANNWDFAITDPDEVRKLDASLINVSLERFLPIEFPSLSEFREWLAIHAPDDVVGNSETATGSPLANFLREIYGAQGAEIRGDNWTYNWTIIHGFSYAGTLPEWAQLVTWATHNYYGDITAARASELAADQTLSNTREYLED